MTHVLRNLREKFGLTQAALADAVGLSRQSLNAIEAGRSVPSVALALKLARTLETSVERLFGEADSEQVHAELAGAARSGARVVLGWLRERWVAHTSFGASGSADGFLRSVPSRTERMTVELTRPAADVKQSVLVAGCAPGLGLLTDRLNGDHGPGRFRWLTRSNAAALRELAASHVHLAGVHLPKRDSGAVARSVARHLPSARAEIYALSTWEAGLVVAKGNPRRVSGVAALSDTRMRVALREVGSGARQQLERLMRRNGDDPSALRSRAVPVRSHMDVGYAVSLGAADVGFAIRAVAIELDLDFVPLVEERFDLIIPDTFLEDERCRRMLDTLASGVFRRELSVLGYDVAQCGSKIADAVAT